MSLKDSVKKIEDLNNTKVLIYVTNDLNGPLGTRVGTDVIPFFKNILKKQGIVEKRTLILNTNGGSLDAVWPIVSLIREFTTKTFEVIVLSKALSAGTLISLGADKIIMPMGTFLSPIDPATTITFNDNNGKLLNKNFAIEDIMGYINFSKEKIGLKNQDVLAKVLDNITQECPPVMLGGFNRIHSLIRNLSRKLLALSKGKKDIKKISKNLIEDLYSHNHLINFAEIQEIGLSNVERPNEDLDNELTKLFSHYKNLMFLDEFALNFQTMLTPMPPSQSVKITGAHVYSLDLGYEYVFDGNMIVDSETQMKKLNLMGGSRKIIQ